MGSTIITLAAVAVLGVGGFYAVRSLQESGARLTNASNDEEDNGIFGSTISPEAAFEIIEWGWGKI